MCGSELCFLAYIFTHCDFIAYPIRVFQSLDVRFDNKPRSANKSENTSDFSNVLDLVVWIVTCRCVPDPPSFLVNVKKNGIGPGDEASIHN